MKNVKDIEDIAKDIGIVWEKDIQILNINDILENSFLTEPKCNCRDIKKERATKTLEDMIDNKIIDIIFSMWNTKLNKYVVGDGNHLQYIVRNNPKIMNKLGLSCTTIKSWLMIGDASSITDSWKLFCFSYRMNRNSLSETEKLKAIYLGFQHYESLGIRAYAKMLAKDLNEEPNNIPVYKSIFLSLESNGLLSRATTENWNSTDIKNELKRVKNKSSDVNNGKIDMLIGSQYNILKRFRDGFNKTYSIYQANMLLLEEEMITNNETIDPVKINGIMNVLDELGNDYSLLEKSRKEYEKFINNISDKMNNEELELNIGDEEL